MTPLLLSATQSAGLRHVKAGPGPVDISRFPDFLIIGPQRTGTTWLHFHLRWHPQLMCPFSKEIFFFSRLKDHHDPKFESDQLNWYLGHFHDPPWLWALKQARCLARYRRPYRVRVRGEATASYAPIDRDVIEEIALLNPDIKVIMMVRDPIERAWSHAKKDLVRNSGRAFEEVSDHEFEVFFDNDYQRRCARYVDNLDNWSACLKDGHVKVGRFDDLRSRPEDYLLEVMEFLGVDADHRYVEDSARPVNPTGDQNIPAHHRRFLEELLAEDVEKLRTRLGMSW